MIPKIIHQIAPADQNRWHKMWTYCSASWKKHYPNFKFVMWNDDDIDNIVKNHYNEYFELYESFPRQIIKIDFARFCILHKYGGIYADMDLYCYKNFYKELKDGISLVEMGTNVSSKSKKVVAYENSLMVSNKGNSFWLDCMKEVKERLTDEVIDIVLDAHISSEAHRKMTKTLLNIAGPGMLTDTASKYKVNTLCWQEYNNDWLTYKPTYKTKHMLTGVWGKESIEAVIENLPFENFQEASVSTYKGFRQIDMSRFDFYKNYRYVNENKSNTKKTGLILSGNKKL